MCPTEYTAAKIANANANEIVLSSVLPNGLFPVRNTVSGTEPAPMKTRMAVPMTSAVSFCDRVGDDVMVDPVMASVQEAVSSGVTYGDSSAASDARAASASDPSAATVITLSSLTASPSNEM